MTHRHTLALTFILPDELAATKLVLMVHDAIHAQACFVWDKDREAYAVQLEEPQTPEIDIAGARITAAGAGDYCEQSDAPVLARVEHVIAVSPQAGIGHEQLFMADRRTLTFDADLGAAKRFATRKAAESYLDHRTRAHPANHTLSVAFVARCPEH